MIINMFDNKKSIQSLNFNYILVFQDFYQLIKINQDNKLMRKSDWMVDRFDQIKEQVASKATTKKPQTIAKPIQTNKSIKFPYRLFRNLLILGIAGAFIYDAEKQFSYITTFFKGSDITSELKVQTLKEDTILRAKKIKNFNFTYDSTTPNKLYISKIEGLLCRMKTYTPIIKIHEKYQANFRFWIFSFNADKQTTLINKYGDVINQKRKYLLSLGQSIGLPSKQQQLLKESQFWVKVGQSLNNEQKQNQQKQQKPIGKLQLQKACTSINFWNRMFKTTQQHEQLVKDCQQKAQSIQNKIIKQIINRQIKYKNML